ncbi:M13 family metallopeptidase [Mycoplasma corogypsi]|uniref:M13 family metallopeptidase n=1 Tax=Mycoplasma corogypsi TaxID=2106 RepID=UPI003872F134
MNEKLIKKDFYEAVNGHWIKKKKIPNHLGSISSYSELGIELEKKLRKQVDRWAFNKEKMPDNDGIKQFVMFYKMLLNTKQQRKLGWTPVLNELEIIETIKNFKDINDNYQYYSDLFSCLPFHFEIAEDFVENDIYTLWISEDSLLLPSKEYYEQENKDQLLKTISSVVLSYMQQVGKTEEQAKKIIKNALEFDRKVVEYHWSSEELMQVEKMYNVYTKEQVQKFSKTFDLVALTTETIKQELDQYIITNPKYFENLDKLFNDEDFEKFRDLMYMRHILSCGAILTPETRLEYFKIKQLFTGALKPLTIKKWAYSKALSCYGDIFSLYWGEKNFTEFERQEVEKMIQKIIDVYKDRLKNNTWLTKSTVEKAIKKLDNIKPMIGYPEYISPVNYLLKTTPYKDGGNIITNLNHFSLVISEYTKSLYKKQVDRKLWGMYSFEVNAYFNPLANSIVFPAGYLQVPFFDVNRNSSLNYAGLGMTIGHEISHAFDNNGAQFDENGKFVNWWTEEDYAAFKQKTEQMVKLFDGFKTPFGKINGRLTVSENIADQGGIISALIAAQTEDDFDADQFFRNYAWCERGKSKKEIAINKLLTDPHSPAKERVNLQLKILKDFQQFYKVSKDDPMYTPLEDIFEIW